MSERNKALDQSGFSSTHYIPAIHTSDRGKADSWYAHALLFAGVVKLPALSFELLAPLHAHIVSTLSIKTYFLHLFAGGRFFV